MNTKDLTIIAQQEALLYFDAFDNSTAWLLGESIKKLCVERGLKTTIEIRLCRETVFFYAMPGTSPNNADWARRKRNTTELMQCSSYAVGLALREGEKFEQQSGLPLRDFSCHGGSFPIRVRGVGAVGAVTVSGLPQREDHNIVVQAISNLTEIDYTSCKLE